MKAFVGYSDDNVVVVVFQAICELVSNQIVCKGALMKQYQRWNSSLRRPWDAVVLNEYHQVLMVWHEINLSCVSIRSFNIFNPMIRMIFSRRAFSYYFRSIFQHTNTRIHTNRQALVSTEYRRTRNEVGPTHITDGQLRQHLLFSSNLRLADTLKYLVRLCGEILLAGICTNLCKPPRALKGSSMLSKTMASSLARLLVS